ncbi:MAG: urease accessory protein UreF [Pseudomonadota bacterium]|nr:urease accessory protein UreF [Pseudomonadota bacterium]
MLARIRLLQMASQAFPIGGYSHSHGLEAAIEAKLVGDEESVRGWIADALAFSIATYDIPVLHDLGEAWVAEDFAALSRLNAQFLATRESAELRSATAQMGFSMRKLLAALPDLPDFLLNTLHLIDEPSLPCVWSGAVWAWGIPACESVAAYLWSWAENQVLVAMKSVPIGQSTAQRVLLSVGEQIARLAERVLPCEEHMRSNFVPGLAILCSQHETQYSRLFRS